MDFSLSLLFGWFLFSIWCPINGSVTLPGNAPLASGTTFTFPIKTTAFYQLASGIIFGAATPPGADAAAWSLSYTMPQLGMAVPLAGQKTVTINNVREQPNPIHNASIAYLDRLGMQPVVVTQEAPATISILVLDTNNEISAILQTTVTTIEEPAQPAVITSLATVEDVEQNRGDDVSQLSTNMAIYTTVRPAGPASFGDPGSGLTLSLLGWRDEKVGLLALQYVSYEAITLTSPFLRPGTTAITQITGTQALCTDSILGQLYCGMTAIAGVGSDAGAYSVVGSGATHEINLHSPVDSSAIPAGADVIIGVLGDGRTASARYLSVMHTTTRLPYLIVNGGVDGNGNLERQVYALPLLFSSGRLAKITTPPSIVYTQTGQFQRREFTVAATAPGDCYSTALTTANAPARVGASELPNRCEQLIVRGDAVYASVAQDGTARPAGLYHSQALFSPDGAIIRWTPWRLAGGIAQPVEQAAVDRATAIVWNVTTPVGGGDFTRVTRTIWSNATTDIGAIAQSFFPAQTGGVQEIAEILRSVNTPTYPGYLVALGFEALTLFQADQLTGSMLVPVTKYPIGYQSTDGTLTGFLPGTATYLATSGGALAGCGALSTCTIATDGTIGWIIAAGSDGIAALATASGSGFSGLSDGFTGLTDTFQWHKLSCTAPDGTPITTVEKLISVGSQLYILTRTALYRLPIDTQTFVPGAVLTPFVIAQANPVQHETYADCWIYNQAVLLATSRALMRNGNGTDPALATTATECTWTDIPLPYAYGGVTRIVPVGLVEDSTGAYANFYLLVSTVGQMNSMLYRLTFHYEQTVTDATFVPLIDPYTQTITGPALSWGAYRNGIATDGACFGTGRSRYHQQTAFFELLNPKWSAFTTSYRGQRLVTTRTQVVLAQPNSARTGRPIISNASGAWLVPYGTSLMSNA